MRGYVVNGPNASGASTKTGVAVIASTSVRPAVFDLLIGNSAAPADVGAMYALSRFTTVGTAGSSPVPSPLDPSDVAAVATAGITHSAEPTYTLDLLQLPLNSRGTQRFVCVSGYEYKAPATANCGLGARLVSASSALASNFNVIWFE